MLTDRPMIRVELKLADGSKLEREWNFSNLREAPPGTAPGGPDLRIGPPAWLAEPNREWPDPQGPLVFTGTVPSGMETTAREWLGLPVE